MSQNSETPNRTEGAGPLLDRTLAAMRDAEPEPRAVGAAASRVLEKLETAHRKIAPFPDVRAPEPAHHTDVGRAHIGLTHIDGCTDFRSLIPAYLARTLDPSGVLLWEDHANSCVACRKALDAARSGNTGDTMTGSQIDAPRQPGRSRHFRTVAVAALAASILIAMVLGTGFLRDLLSPIDAHATARSIQGGLYLVSGQDIHTLAAGQRIERGQAVRTGTGSGAVLELADGSRVEMSARAELSLGAARDGVKVALRRGRVIVTAAKQHGGHLYIETPDCAVSVVGTVFSVSAEPKGSRVAVIEGAVEVRQGSETAMLHPGEQMATDPAMQLVSVRDEFSWSQDAAAHLELLGALSDLGADFSQRMGDAEMRFQSDLIGMVPANTVVVASLPNVSEPASTAYALFKQRIHESDTLRAWWAQSEQTPAGAAQSPLAGVDGTITRLMHFGTYLGPEIVLAFSKDLENEAPIVLAGLRDGEASAEKIAEELRRIDAFSVQNPDVTLAIGRDALDNAAQAGVRLAIYVDRDWIAVSSPKQIQRAAAFRENPAANSFAATPLGRRVATSYTEGVGWLLAADLGRIVVGAPTDAGPGLRWLGLDNVDQLLVEQKTGRGNAAFSATLGFNDQRHGVTAWMAEPAPMGALEFVSPNAYSVAAIVTKNPASIVDDIFGLLTKNSDTAEAIDTYQRERRIDIRRDLAEPLGNEFLIAIDGPILPSPAWRAVIEVNDAARLQSAIETAVNNANRGADNPVVTISSEISEGRTFYRLVDPKSGAEIHYVYWCGYMVAGPKRALVVNSMDSHDTANSLARSPAFRAQLPDGRSHASGVLYQNVQAIAKAIPVQGLSQAIAKAAPSVVYMFGEPDRIVFASKGDLGANLTNLAGIASLGQLGN